MYKKIYKNMTLLVFFSSAVLSIFLSLVFFSVYSGNVKKELQDKMLLIENIIEREIDISNDSYINILESMDLDSRLTLISPEGAVLFDNSINPETMGNHLDRTEIKEALELGHGESNRLSASQGTKTFYYSAVLNDNNILRISQTTKSIYSVLFKLIPWIIFLLAIILLACYYISKKLTSNIVNPLLEHDFDYTKGDFYDELSPFIRKINTQQKELELQHTAYKERGETINAILGNMQEGIIILDKNSNILLANDSVLKLYNYKDKIKKQNIINLIRNRKILNAIEKAIDGTNNDMILKIDEKYYHLFLNQIKNQGIIMLFLDITEKTLSENKRKEFSANVSHELKTPLTNILGYSEIISTKTVKEEDIQEFSEKVTNEAKRLLTLVEDIIILSEIDEKSDGKSSNENFENFDLYTLLLEVIKDLEFMAKSKNVTLMLIGDPTIIYGGKSLYYDMMQNLINNAIKYNKEDGEVLIKILNFDGKTRVTIEDTGIGINKKDINRVFERFYVIDKSRSKKREGTGLGLSIVKNIASLHDIKINIDSNINSGTKITLDI